MNSQDQELLEEYERRIAAGTDLDGLIPVKARVPRNPRAVFSLRLSKDEYEVIARAAEARGQGVSDFIRDAAMDSATLLDRAEPEEYNLSAVRADVARIGRKLDRAVKKVETGTPASNAGSR
jgi:uncharacterized protein (DUF1778 family)